MDHAGKRILVADDSSSVRAALGKLLLAEGYQVLTACDGHDVFHQLAREKVDLVLLDLDMPEPNGWQVLEQLAAEQPHLPVIVVSAHPDECAWSTSHGASAVVEKPPDIPSLLELIRSITTARPPARRISPRFTYVPPGKFDFRIMPEHR